MKADIQTMHPLPAGQHKLTYLKFFCAVSALPDSFDGYFGLYN
jgi:hypothetical protein